MSRFIVCLFVVVIGFGSPSCNDEEITSNCYLPAAAVSQTINTDLPTNFHLKSLGAYIYLPGGNKGIILIHNFDDQFVAVERACTYNPDEECARIYVDSVNLLLRCGSFNDTIWEPCCASQFEYDGTLRSRPARCPLRPYGVSENGSTLTIFN